MPTKAKGGKGKAKRRSSPGKGKAKRRMSIKGGNPGDESAVGYQQFVDADSGNSPAPAEAKAKAEAPAPAEAKAKADAKEFARTHFNKFRGYVDQDTEGADKYLNYAKVVVILIQIGILIWLYFTCAPLQKKLKSAEKEDESSEEKKESKKVKIQSIKDELESKLAQPLLVNLICQTYSNTRGALMSGEAAKNSSFYRGAKGFQMCLTAFMILLVLYFTWGTEIVSSPILVGFMSVLIIMLMYQLVAGKKSTSTTPKT